MNRSETRRVRPLRVVGPLAVLALSVVLCLVLIRTAPKTVPQEEERPPKIVQTIEVRPTTERIAVTAYGAVIPARQVTIIPQVEGRVVRLHGSLVPGGFIPEGDELLGIDRSDYELALTEQKALLEQAKFEMAVENGRQVIASREWLLLENDLPENEANRSLVLREPHLRRTQALVEKAQNAIAKAELDLNRTSIAAPFNVMVLEESVEVGQLVAPGPAVATLVGTDEFWVRASVPIEMLKWIRLPDAYRQDADQEGARARVILETGNDHPIEREGRVVRLLGDLEPAGRMARVLVTIPDPLSLAASSRELPLLLGSFVRVEIEAGELEDVVAIDRSALRNGGEIWVVDPEDHLQIRAVPVLWARGDSVLIPNVIRPEERLIVSGLRLAVPGMEVTPRPVSPQARVAEDQNRSTGTP